MQPNRIGSIDGLRGVAALAVALMHYQTWFIGERVALWGNIPTQLFFILSGYILTVKYEDSLRSGAVSAWSFIVQRVSRLWPLHMFALLLLVASEWLFWNYYGRFHILGPSDTFYAFVLNALMIHDWGFYSPPNFNIPSWSISSELAVNLLWMIALLFGRWRLGLALTVAALSVALMLTVHPTLNYNAFATVYGIAQGILRTILGFALGCAICWHVRRRGSSMPTSLSGATQIALVMCLVFYSSLERFGVDWILSIVLLPAITLVALNPATITARLMDTAVMRWLGAISYSVYLLHLPIGNLMSLPLVWGTGLPPGLYLGLVWIAIVLAASTATLYAIERPGIRWIRKLATGRVAIRVPRPSY